MASKHSNDPKQNQLSILMKKVMLKDIERRVAIFPGDIFPGKRETNVSFPEIPGSRERF